MLGNRPILRFYHFWVKIFDTAVRVCYIFHRLPGHLLGEAIVLSKMDIMENKIGAGIISREAQVIIPLIISMVSEAADINSN